MCFVIIQFGVNLQVGGMVRQSVKGFLSGRIVFYYFSSVSSKECSYENDRPVNIPFLCKILYNSVPVILSNLM